MKPTTKSQIIASRLALLKAGFRAREIARLAELAGDAEGLFKAELGWFLEVGASEKKAALAITDAVRAFAQKEIALADEHGIDILVPESDDYPDELRMLHDIPAALYVKGELGRDERRIAVVGTRKPTYDGGRAAREFARDFAREGAVVVSGLAIGVDATAHEGALDGGGRTIAVLGSGLLNIYPPQNRRLASKIASQGALVSEYFLEQEPEHYHFPMRNRIIAALSVATLVVEAPKKSGSLITADQALEQGKDVFAIPGGLRAAQSAGTNHLIKQGASCVTESSDVLLALGWVVRSKKSAPPKVYSDLVLRVLALDGEMSLEEIALKTGLGAAELMTRLSELEAKGELTQTGGSRYAIRGI